MICSSSSAQRLVGSPPRVGRSLVCFFPVAAFKLCPDSAGRSAPARCGAAVPLGRDLHGLVSVLAKVDFGIGPLTVPDCPSLSRFTSKSRTQLWGLRASSSLCSLRVLGKPRCCSNCHNSRFKSESWGFTAASSARLWNLLHFQHSWSTASGS